MPALCTILSVSKTSVVKIHAKSLAKMGAHWGQKVHCDQPVHLSDICRQTALSTRGLSTLPNILRKNCKELYMSKERPGPVVGGMQFSVSALGLLHQARNATTTTQQDSQETSGEGSENKKEKSKDKWYSGKNAWKLGLLSLGFSGVSVVGLMLASWGPPLTDPDGNEIPDEFSILPKWEAYPKRALKECFLLQKMIQEPSSRKLLPDSLNGPYYPQYPKYTLVLELTGVLVHPDWTLNTGWRFKKRPAVEYFLHQVGPLFEVVIYTRESGMTALPIVENLDPEHQSIMFRLFRDATRYQNGVHMKDLDCLNRDPSKVIIVDWNPKAVSLQPRNAFMLPKWTGADDDKTLVDLAAFLRTVASMGVDDVRTVLDHYNASSDPLETFKLNQTLLMEQQEQDRAMLEEQKKKLLTGDFGGFGLGRKR